MTKDPNEVVTIVHPDIEKAASCTREQFEKVYEDRGWKVAAEGDDTPLATSQRSKGPATRRAREREVKGKRQSRKRAGAPATAPGNEGS